RKNKEFRILAFPCNQVDAVFGKVHAIIVLLDNKVQRLVGLRHKFLVLLQVDAFGALQNSFYTRFTEELDQWLVFGHAPERTEQRKATVFLVAFSDQPSGIIQVLVDKFL